MVHFNWTPPHQHTADRLAAKELSRGEEGGDSDAKHAVHVHALTCLEEVRNGGARREKCARQVVTVTADAVGRSVGRARVAMVSPGRGGGHALDRKVGREGDVFAESLLALLRRYGLPSGVSGVLSIILGVPSEEAVDTGSDGMQDIERGDGARVGRVRRTARDEIAGGDLAAVVVPERFVAVVDADVAVEVWDGGVGRVNVQGEEAERVPERLNALAVDPSEEAAVGRDKPDGERGVDVGDEGAALDAFAVRELGGCEATVGGDETRDAGTGAHCAAGALDLLDESADDGHATATQSPGALDVRVVDLSEDVERQGVGVKLHLHRRAGEDAAQARVGDGALEEGVGRLAEALTRMSAGGVDVVEEVSQ